MRISVPPVLRRPPGWRRPSGSGELGGNAEVCHVVTAPTALIVAQSCRVVAISSLGLGEKFLDGSGSGAGCPGSSPASAKPGVRGFLNRPMDGFPGPALSWPAFPCWCRIFRYSAPKVCALRPERTCAIRLVLFPEACLSGQTSFSHSCPPSGGGAASLQSSEGFPVGLCFRRA